jgi:cell pole-organizing protein PopZ
MDDSVAKDSDDAPDDRLADVLDLTGSRAAPAPPPPVFRTIEGQSDVFLREEAEPAPPPPRTEESVQSGREPSQSPLMSSSTSAAVDAAFNKLARTVLTQNARTLEDLVTEMMRPMLKAWLDDNLPGLVERVVRAEIERVSRGRS